MFAFGLDKLVYLSKTAPAMHATARHNMFALGSSTLLICGGTKMEIVVFTKLLPQADLRDLGDKCQINVFNVVYSIPWLKCVGPV